MSHIIYMLQNVINNKLSLVIGWTIELVPAHKFA